MWGEGGGEGDGLVAKSLHPKQSVCSNYVVSEFF
jgi:hypothetical protein